MKKYLISPEGTFYKANLHCHTTNSDGTRTPQQVKERYQAGGYSIVAYTDHCLLLPHHEELSDQNFLALNGYETEINSVNPDDPNCSWCCHIGFIALKEDNVTMPYYCEKSLWGNGLKLAHKAKFNMEYILDSWEYSPETVNRVIRLGREQGFFVTYNHPAWSLEHYPQYSHYTGMHAVEIFNYSCLSCGHDTHSPWVYDDLILKGERIFCVGGDDNHHLEDSCGCWTMIKAPDLQYETITDALLRGDFYASNGPQIRDLWMDGDKVHISTSPAKRIICAFARRRPFVVNAGQEALTEAEFPILPTDSWFRLTVEDDTGHFAHTNAYFADEVLQRDFTYLRTDGQ